MTHRLNSSPDRANLSFLAKSDFPEITRQRPHQLRLALLEAEALALETGFPDLVALDLAREKLETLHRWHARQQDICRGYTPAGSR